MAICSEFHKGDTSSSTVAASSGLSVLWNFDQVAKKVTFLLLPKFVLCVIFLLCIMFLSSVAFSCSLFVSQFQMEKWI